MTEFSTHEAAVLNYVQQNVPFDDRPYKIIGSELDISEKEVMTIISGLRKQNVIRNIAAIFNGASLGYFLNLVAMEIPENRIETAAALINSHPGVSHNYIRKHKYNIWFTLAEESEEVFKDTVQFLADNTGAKDHLILRNEKLLKIGVVLPIGDESHGAMENGVDNTSKHAKARNFTQNEKEAIQLFQYDLPVVERPFLSVLENNNSSLSENDFLALGNALKEGNVMRRYSAVLRHVNAGYTYNAMTTWKIDDNSDLNEKTKVFVDEPAVSHLYLRTIFPGRWEYPLFAMIHARSKVELDSIINKCAKKSGIKDYVILPTLRELKKKRVVYFSHEFAQWRDKIQ